MGFLFTDLCLNKSCVSGYRLRLGSLLQPHDINITLNCHVVGFDIGWHERPL